MKRHILFYMGTCAALLTLQGTAAALPVLQLDIPDGVYDTSTETIVATDSSFMLYALLTPSRDTSLLSDTYYLSVALAPPQDNLGVQDLGSFTVNGTEYAATADLFYGIPPYEALISTDPNDLASHGMFETYFTEIAFQFDPANNVESYNTQDAALSPDPDDGLNLASSGGTYYSAFSIDTSGLSAGLALHFDLYSTYTEGDQVGIALFAPFSHDAQSMPVPEPGTLLLTGAGLITLASSYRRKRQQQEG